MKVLEVENLRKSFKDNEVLKGVNFFVREKEILGFIGPNGSGKTTTMKCIATLLFVDEGKITIFDFDNVKERSKALEKMSVQIESPGLYYNLSGIENLKLFAKLKKVDKSRIESIIEFINIKDGMKKKVKTYSMGMKQRLALGITLLSDPKFIMLDEPTNGLDPDGVIKLRKMIFKLREEGVSFLISSHQLSEIEKLCDRIIAINDGKVKDISFYVETTQSYNIWVKELNLAKEITFNNDLIKSYSFKENFINVTFKNELGLNSFIDVLRNNNIVILSINKVDKSIEDVYSDIYGIKRWKN